MTGIEQARFERFLKPLTKTEQRLCGNDKDKAIAFIEREMARIEDGKSKAEYLQVEYNRKVMRDAIDNLNIGWYTPEWKVREQENALREHLRKQGADSNTERLRQL